MNVEKMAQITYSSRVASWHADVAQSVERIHGKDEVAGSIPAIGSDKVCHLLNTPHKGYILEVSATVAQLVEHFTRNEKVAGSIPAGGSQKQKRSFESAFAILVV